MPSLPVLGLLEDLGRHFMETGERACLSKKQILTVFDEIRILGATASAHTADAMSKDFPTGPAA